MKSRVLITAVLFCLGSSMAWSSSVYKWTDANGHVHFGDQSPDGVKSQKMDIQTGTAEKMAHPQAGKKKAGNKAAQGQDKNAKQVDVAKQRKRSCQAAKKNLNVLNHHSRVRIKGKSGKFHYLTPQQIEKKKQQFRNAIKQDCGPPSR